MAADDKRNITWLLITLLSIPSPTGQEMPLLRWLEAYLSSCQFKISWQEIKPGWANLIAWRGKSKYLIATHVDTTPAWDHPQAFSPMIKENKIWGRGAVDTKGQIAALLHTVSSTDSPCALAFFIDEEKEGLGSENFKPFFNFEGAIVLEPTNLSLSIAEAGNIELNLRFQGKAVHGAVGRKGKNGIEVFYEFMEKLKSIEPLQFNHPLFLDSKINIGKIKGGIDCQVVADKCEAEIDIPILPGVNLEKTWQEILSLLGDFPVTWERKSFDPPFEISKEEKVVKHLEKCVSPYISVKYTGMPAWTDAAHLLEKGIKSVIFGAGDLALAHTPEEHIGLDQLITLSHILKEFLENI